MEPIFGEEQGNSKGFDDGVVLRELGEGKEGGPVVLLIVDVLMKVWFHDCLD